MVKWILRWALWLYVVYRALPFMKEEERHTVEIPWMVGLMALVFPFAYMFTLGHDPETLTLVFFASFTVYLFAGLLLLVFYARKKKAFNTATKMNPR